MMSWKCTCGNYHNDYCPVGDSPNLSSKINILKPLLELMIINHAQNNQIMRPFNYGKDDKGNFTGVECCILGLIIYSIPDKLDIVNEDVRDKVSRRLSISLLNTSQLEIGFMLGNKAAKNKYSLLGIHLHNFASKLNILES